MALDLAEIIGTGRNDDLTGSFYSIVYGLGGDDELSTMPSVDYQVLAGGSGNDVYRVGYGHVGVVYDSQGSDYAWISGVRFDSYYSYLAEIDGRHLVAFNTATGTAAYLLDYRSSSVSELRLDDATISLNALTLGLHTIENYLGNFTWAEFSAEIGSPINSQDFYEEYAHALEREQQLEHQTAITPLTLEEAQHVALLYETALDRNGNIDLEGLNWWIDRREEGLGERKLAKYFLDSDEFRSSFGDPDAMNDEALVEQLYLNVLDRVPDEEGLAFWVDIIERDDIDRADMLYYFSISQENAEPLDFLDTLTESSDGFWTFG